MLLFEESKFLLGICFQDFFLGFYNWLKHCDLKVRVKEREQRFRIRVSVRRRKNDCSSLYANMVVEKNKSANYSVDKKNWRMP